MHRRGLLFMLASAAVGEVAVPTRRLAEAEEMEVTKTDEESGVCSLPISIKSSA
jgi:hypothetical protein